MKHYALSIHRMDAPDRYNGQQTNKQTNLFFVNVLDGV